MLVAAALVLSKLVHELGHAFAAKRLGCRVPSMGVAFVLLWPLAWTDTTQAWRLPDRRSRAWVGLAGVTAELALAAFAAPAWAVMPDGPARGAAHALAAVAPIAAVAVNLNPFLRFDGYFVLSDWLDEPNLQDRACALGRWRLRRLLFGLREAPPEALPAPRRRLLIAWAWAAWCWRLAAFLGLALLVYGAFFKVLGVVLFLVEIWWFIARPIAREIAGWWRRGAELVSEPRAAFTLAAFAVGVAAPFIPWRGTVTAPALLLARQEATLYAPEGATVARVHAAEDATVAAGQPLFVLHDPDAEHRLGQATRRVAALEEIAAAWSADVELSREVPVAIERLREQVAEREQARSRLAALTVTAPFAGRLAEVSRLVAPGGGVAAREPLGVLVAPGARAWFYADAPEIGAVPLRLASLDSAATRRLAEPEAASTRGGGVAVRDAASSDPVPEGAVFRATFSTDADLPAGLALRGVVAVQAEPESYAKRLWRGVIGVTVRETGW